MNADCACYSCCRETFPKSFECWQPPDAITHYCRGKGMKPNLSRSHLESPALDSGLLCALKHMKLLSCTSQEVMLAPERLVHKSTYHKFQHRKTDYPRTVQPHNAPYIYIYTHNYGILTHPACTGNTIFLTSFTRTRGTFQLPHMHHQKEFFFRPDQPRKGNENSTRAEN